MVYTFLKMVLKVHDFSQRIGYFDPIPVARMEAIPMCALVE